MNSTFIKLFYISILYSETYFILFNRTSAKGYALLRRGHPTYATVLIFLIFTDMAIWPTTAVLFRSSVTNFQFPSSTVLPPPTPSPIPISLRSLSRIYYAYTEQEKHIDLNISYNIINPDGNKGKKARSTNSATIPNTEPAQKSET